MSVPDAVQFDFAVELSLEEIRFGLEPCWNLGAVCFKTVEVFMTGRLKNSGTQRNGYRSICVPWGKVWDDVAVPYNVAYQTKWVEHFFKSWNETETASTSFATVRILHDILRQTRKPECTIPGAAKRVRSFIGPNSAYFQNMWIRYNGLTYFLVV